MKKILIGVDEAGRGPLAGPVAVGIVAVPAGFNIKKALPGVGDSKVLTEKKREELYVLAVQLKKEGVIDFCVRFASHTTIDDIGITKAVKKGVRSGIRSLAPDTKDTHVLLDGLLSAPEEYSQETIIKGDATEPVISLASIIAKVSRDRLMHRLAKEYPEYGFEIHKGYGTKKHLDAISKFGLSEIHRRTYCHV
ncbi:ribonuclease HII [Patescibacteria group bacterium]|nr:ribonuclease HII [Patescibacteria group bacterium]